MAFKTLVIAVSACVLASTVALESLAQERLRDPTQPPVSTQQTQQREDMALSGARQLALSAVVINGDQRIARLGTHSVTVGQQILGATVLAIHSDHVAMRDNDGEFRLSWPNINMVSPAQETPEA